MNDVIRLGVHGAAGRMGRRIVALAMADPAFRLVAAIDLPTSPTIGKDAGTLAGAGQAGVPISDAWTERPDVLIDFSVPEASLAIAKVCHPHGVPLVVATTGHSPAQKAELLELHHEMPLLLASNMSLVVNVLMKLAADASRILRDRDFDVEIIERHHRHKADAPSGTALRFAEIIEQGMGLTQRVHGREGITGERPRHEIGLHALRGGDNVGEHTIVFSAPGETMELVHKGTSRDSYAHGALAAAKFLATRPPGLYGMNDVLGL